MDDRSLAFHGLAIKRHANAAGVAALTGQPPGLVERELGAAIASGRAVEARGAYSLTPLARVWLQASYGLHFADLRANEEFSRAYHGFERINPDLKQIITDWQTRDVRGERRTNDHSDGAYDGRVLDRLADLHEQAGRVFAILSRHLPRLKIYSDKLEAALDKAEGGDGGWVSDIHRDSYHTVWFELHEELLRIMGREREE